MINDPKLINKIIEQIENVPKEILDEVLDEVLEEQNYLEILNNLPTESYNQNTSYYNCIGYYGYFELLHKNRTYINIDGIMEVAA